MPSAKALSAEQNNYCTTVKSTVQRKIGIIELTEILKFIHSIFIILELL